MHQIVKVGNYSFLPTFREHFNVLWDESGFWVNFCSKHVSFFLRSENEEITFIKCIDLNGVINFQIAFFDVRSLVPLKLDFEYHSGLYYLAFIPLF